MRWPQLTIMHSVTKQNDKKRFKHNDIVHVSMIDHQHVRLPIWSDLCICFDVGRQLRGTGYVPRKDLSSRYKKVTS